MKFSDIPQLTRDGSYRVNVTLDYLVEHLDRLIEEHGLQLCPDFQRGHVWNQDQRQAFVKFLLRGGRGSSQIRFNCPGWMLDFRGPLVLVDGLQRLTSVLQFLDNEFTAFGHYYKDFEGRIPFHINLEFLINDLPCRADVLQWYIDLNAGGVVHTDDEIARVRRLLASERETT